MEYSQPILSVEQARERILETVRPLPSEAAALSEALGRFTAEPLRSTIDLPPADNSAMDGYAVRTDDLASATATAPVALRVIGTAPAGVVLDEAVEAGTCARVFTGSLLPRGADAVVMQEDVKQNSEDSSSVLFFESAPPWDNVRLRGEDVKTGAVLLEAGERLTAPRLSLLAAAGISTVRVARRPIVGLLATGDELREAGRPLEAGAIYESNRIGLAALALQAGAMPKVYPLVRDELSATQAALEQAFAESDVVISTGGVSVGEMDWVKPAFAAIGGQLDFWRVDMRPGKPFAFGRWKEKLFFGLPGNPVSALVSFLLLAKPALLQLQGAREVLPRTISVVLTEPLVNHAERRHFMRVSLDGRGGARSAGNQSSHVLSAMARAHGLVDVPPSTTLAEGAQVLVLTLD
ncbi:MAG TPA: gephyrin-like molybdotransferase Glp [Verrucomicrobiae bacterium]|nr:gephyrin-like molybdotransferase Glp [Verrucomicrobiae bacterium]